MIKLRFYSNLREGDVLKFKCKITYINIYIYMIKIYNIMLIYVS